MAEYILMPKLGFNMDTGKLVTWRKKEGESVKRGEVFFVIMTDKTAMEIEATSDTVLLKILAEEGQEVPVTLPIAIVGQVQEDIAAMIAAATGQSIPAEATSAPTTTQASDSSQSKPVISGEIIRISPRARKYLEQKKLDISGIQVPGTGFQGGVTQKDLESYFAKNARTPARTAASQPLFADQREILRTVPYSGVRKIIGDRLTLSQSTVPHVSFTTSVDCQELIEFRAKANDALLQKVSFTDFIVMASARALQIFPQINAALQQDRIVQFKDINIGVAVALENGLIVPVVRKAQNKKLAEIATEIRELSEKARSGRLSPDEYQGGTFTISNLGMLDVEHFTSIINPPEAAILGVGAMKKQPAVITVEGADQLVIRPMMNLTVTVDHRLIDGREAVLFLTEIKQMLERPLKIFV